jgi:ubiquinone/menaquinone biosynthesis C-methylase UbiE
MSSPKEPPREHPSTYFVQDRSNKDEMARLEVLDKMLTTSMGGVLLELPDPTILRRVLDVGCGTGHWLIETARAYPTIEKLIGGDISEKIIEYARAQAESAALNRRVQFQTMDALRILEFPDASFDLVNQRGGTSWLRTWDWRKILLEYQRVCRPGGIIRITEANMNVESNSPALTKICNLSLETFYHSGRLFTASNDGVTSELERLMTQYGIQEVKTKAYTLVYRAGTIECQYFYQNMALWFRVGLPFYQKWTRVPADYQETCEQALKEMQQPDFAATWAFLTGWGIRSKDDQTLLIRGLQ